MNQSRVTSIYESLYRRAIQADRWPCRQCGAAVRTLEDVCPQCGTFSPVRISCPTMVRIILLSMAIVAICSTGIAGLIAL